MALLLLMAAAPLSAEPVLQRIAHTVAQQDVQRDREVPTWTSVRTYRLANPRWETDGVMKARIVRQADGTKRYEILSMQATGVAKRTFLKILNGEMESSRPNEASQSRISAENYNFKLLGEEMVQGRQCHVMQLIPKRRHKLLIEGKAWVDAEDLAVVKVVGRTADRLGFWVGQAEVQQEYRKVGQHWFSSANRSAADVRMFGRTTLSIDYGQYTLGEARTMVAQQMR